MLVFKPESCHLEIIKHAISLNLIKSPKVLGMI